MKYEIFNDWDYDPGKWVSPKRAALTEKEWLHWELSDGTNALSPPSKKGTEWREKPEKAPRKA